ncbi:MAG: MBL fold metallo-hydrolase, partial [Paracoccaceae bacterium]
RNTRRRCSLLVERHDAGAVTRVLVDASPDLREQLLDAGIGLLDGVMFTHPHADHVHGLDDLRMIVFNRGSRLPVWADGPTSDALIGRFGYAFIQPAGSPYPPILDLKPIGGPVRVPGAGGDILFEPFEVVHGTINALGFRIGGLAYLPDVSAIPDTAWPLLEGLDTLVIDALRYTPHPTHTHLEQTLQWIARAAPRRAVITNMHIDLDYATLDRETPDTVTPAHDGMIIELDG